MSLNALEITRSRQLAELERQTAHVNGRAGDAEEKRPRYEVFWLRDALQPQDPVKQITDGVFLEGSLNLVVGEYGTKKTWILIDLAIAVAMGSTWMGKKTSKGPSLIFDEESGQRRLERRIAALARARHAPEDTQLAYVSLAQFDMRKPEDVTDIRRVIVETGAALVVIDAMVDIMPGADENAVQDVQPVLMALRKVAEETRAAIVLIHHTNRSGGFRGSSAIPGAVDLMLKVESKARSNTIEIKSEKARDLEPFELSGHIRFEGDPLDKVFVDAAEAPQKPETYSTSEQFVMDFLTVHGASLLQDIMDNSEPACKPGTAKNAVYALLKRDKVERVDDDGPGVPAVYAIRNSKADANYRLPYKD